MGQTSAGSETKMTAREPWCRDGGGAAVGDGLGLGHRGRFGAARRSSRCSPWPTPRSDQRTTCAASTRWRRRHLRRCGRCTPAPSSSRRRSSRRADTSCCSPTRPTPSSPTDYKTFVPDLVAAGVTVSVIGLGSDSATATAEVARRTSPSLGNGRCTVREPMRRTCRASSHRRRSRSARSAMIEGSRPNVAVHPALAAIGRCRPRFRRSVATRSPGSGRGPNSISRRSTNRHRAPEPLADRPRSRRCVLGRSRWPVLRWPRDVG